MKKKIMTILAMVSLLALVVPYPAIAADLESQPQDPANGITVTIDRGPVFYAAVHTLSTDNPVKEDLIKRGLFIREKIGDTDLCSGQIKFGEIEKLVNSGVYHITASNTLEFGPQLSGENVETLAEQLRVEVHKYSEMKTANLFWDNFNYRGHWSYVDLPSYLPLNSGTDFNVYTSHMAEPNGYFTEAGVGRVSWSDYPIIYTYTNYVGEWNYTEIPGGVSRTVFLYIDVSTNGLATMSVQDYYSGYAEAANQQVSYLNQRVDACQEECSSSNSWTETSYITQRDNELKDSNGTWINWNSSVSTRFITDSYMYESHSIQNDKYSFTTWCDQ